MAGVELGQHLVPGAPPSVYYVPDFITQAEEEGLLRQVAASPAPRWTQLSNRRLQNLGGVPHPKGMLAERLPAWLAPLVARVTAAGLLEGKSANHVLVNEYRAGQGILPHTDGPLFHPSVATVSLGSHTVLRLYSPLEGEGVAHPWEEREVGALLLRPRSLLVLRGEAYSSLLHGIQEVEEDTLGPGILNLGEEEEGTTLARSTRVSLTIRHVPNTTRCKIRIGR